MNVCAELASSSSLAVSFWRKSHGGESRREREEQLRKDAEWEDERQGFMSIKELPLITLSIVALNIVIFAVSFFSTDFQAILFDFGFIPSRLGQLGSLPSLVSHMFLHANFLHIFYNMFVFLQFGILAELRLGRVRFLVLYLLSGIFAVLFYALFTPGSEVPLVGASGAIFGVLTSYALLYPGRPVYMMKYVKMPSIVGVSFVLILEVIFAVLGVNPYIANTAHLGGGIAGILLTATFFPKETGKFLWNVLDAAAQALTPQTALREPESDKPEET
jgi:rhomboid protease GluP